MNDHRHPRVALRVLSVCALLSAPGCGASSTTAAGGTGGGDGTGTAGRAVGGVGANASPVEAMGWMVGHWEKGPSSETWVVSGDSLIGIGMGIRDARTEFFEVMVIDAGDKGLTFTAMPNGLRSVNFATESLSDQAAAFRSPDNPFPKSIAYRRDGESLAVQLHGEGRPDSSFAYSPGERDPSPVLEQADRVFAADSASRGADAWADAFVPDGVLWTRNSGRVEGREAIRAAMSPVFAGGESGLEWQPTASGMSPRGDLGFTVGRYRLTRLRDGGEADTLQSGTYVSIWRRQKDGAWRVVFDTGVPD